MNTLNFVEETAPTFFNVQLYFHNPIAPINRRREEFGIQGNHYGWRHNTMTWQEGTEWMEYLLRKITASIPLPVYGFSTWSIPYLLQMGFSIEQILAFGWTARKMLIKGLDDVEVEYQAEERRWQRSLPDGSRLNGLTYLDITSVKVDPMDSLRYGVKSNGKYHN